MRTLVPRGGWLGKEAIVAVRMVRRFMVLGALGLCAVGAVLAAPPAEEIADAVRRLGDEDFAVREKASRFLWSAGRAAEPALRVAVGQGDAEVARRARQVLEKFKWGIYPDTPSEVVELVTRYRGGDRNAKQGVIQRLVALGSPGRAVLTKLAAAEEDPEERHALFQQFTREIGRLAPQLLMEGKLGDLEALLETGLASDTETSYRRYATFLLLGGRIVAKIHEYQKQLAGPGGARAAEVLLYLCRANNDLAGARQAAEKTGKPALVKSILWEQGAWRELLVAEQRPQQGQPAAPGGDAEALGFVVALQRRAGTARDFESAVADVRRYADEHLDDERETWTAAKALLLNDRPEEAIELLRKSKHRDKAFELLAAQGRFREALESAAQARPEDDKQRIWLEAHKGRTLYTLGETDKALAIFDKLANEVGNTKLLPAYGELVDVEYKLGLQDRAFEHCAGIVLRMHREATVSPLLAHVFPEKGETAEAWWKFLRWKYPTDHASAVMKRLRNVLERKVSAKELEELVAEAEDWVGRLKERVHQETWRQAIADAYRTAGSDDLARPELEKAADAAGASPNALLRLADFLADKKLWREAAARYAQAWGKDQSKPLPLYLQGWCLTQDGRKEEGDKLMRLARWLPLGDDDGLYDDTRNDLAEAFAKRDMPAAARAEFELLLKTGPLDSWYISNARRQLARDASMRKDYLAAAAYDERGMLDCLHTNISYVRSVAYLAIPHLVHRCRARGLLVASRADEALGEVRLALAALPGEVDLPIELVPELEKHGRREAAEALFRRMLDLYENTCAEHPQSAWAHNSAAWLAARCRRHLDRALEHARKAVELAPGESSYLDTLAEVQFQRGDKETAVGLMKKCIAMRPRHDYFHKQLRRFEAGDPSTDVPESSD
jgi:hypothetical protein